MVVRMIYGYSDDINGDGDYSEDDKTNESSHIVQYHCVYKFLSFSLFSAHAENRQCVLRSPFGSQFSQYAPKRKIVYMNKYQMCGPKERKT